MAWDHRYRQLQEGEIILPTDECMTDDKWEPVRHTVGQKAPDPAYTSLRWYRRIKAVDIK